MLNITKTFPPSALIHGMADDGVPIAGSDEWKATLDSLGVPNVLSRVPGAGHGFEVGAENTAGSEMWEKYLRVPVDFFITALKA
ncbi:hypothetical protein RQP46_009659 [Phenoliferia psychrophenolica]